MDNGNAFCLADCETDMTALFLAGAVAVFHFLDTTTRTEKNRTFDLEADAF